MKIRVYRFEKGTSGPFYTAANADVSSELITTLTTEDASSVLVERVIEVATVLGHRCKIERDDGRACVFLPAEPKARRARREPQGSRDARRE